MSKRFPRVEYGLLIAALLPILAILSTLTTGTVQGADTAVHVHRIHAMAQLLQSGNLWPRWVPYFHLGYGYPIFNFYAPGASYLGGLLEIIGLQATLAYSLLNALAWISGSIGIYRLGRCFLPVAPALLAAGLWVYAPSRLYEIWWQGSLSQSLAAAVIPWLFYTIIVTAQKPRFRNSAGIALALAAVILTHQPIMFIAALFAGPLAIFAPVWAARQEWSTLWRRMTCVIGGFALGAALAAIFLLPVVFELQYVNAEQGTDDNVAYLMSNFLNPKEVFTLPQPIDMTDMRLVMPRTLGLVGGILSAVGLGALVVHRRFGLALLLSLGLLFSIFMLLEPSVNVWLTIPYFRQLRFAERFLRIGAVIVGLLGGASLLLLPRRWQSIGLALGSGIVIAQALPIMNPHDARLPLEHLNSVDEIKFELAERAWGTTSYEEFNPIWGAAIAFDPPPEPQLYLDQPLLVPVKELDILRQYPDLQTDQLSAQATRITVTSARPIRFRQYYFPGWSAWIDGQPARLYADDEWGLITIDVPKGQHLVELAYTGTPIQHIGTLISILALGVTAALLRWDWHPTREEQIPRAETLSARAAYGLGALLLGAAILYGLVILPDEGAFKLRSPVGQPMYMTTAAGQTFGGELQLLGYTLDQDRVMPGGEFNITLYWRALHPLDQELAPHVQLVNLLHSEAWGVSEKLAPGNIKTTQYAVERFISDPHQLRVYEDIPPYAAQIGVQITQLESGEPLPLPDGSTTLYLEPLIRIEAPTIQANKLLDYNLGGKVELRCASVSQADGQFNIDLYWYVQETPAQELVTLVHGLADDGALVQQNDSAPLKGLYPAPLWQPGQALADRHTLPYDADIETIAVGLYTAIDIQRLPVLQSGQPVADNLIRLPLKQESCLS